jgi:hypothetical protein
MTRQNSLSRCRRGLCSSIAHSAALAALSLSSAIAIAAGTQPFGQNIQSAARGAVAGGGTGVRVYAQTWVPTRPDDDTPTLILNEPDIVSRALSSAWNTARARMEHDLPAALGRGDLIAPGVTLYNIRIATTPLSGIEWTKPNGWVPFDAASSTFGLSMTISGVQVTFTSTTPDTKQMSQGNIPIRVGLGSYGDPSGYVQLDLQISAQVILSNTPGRTLTVSAMHVVTSNLKVGPTNLPGDLYTSVANWLGIHYQQMADAYFNNCDLVQDSPGSGTAPPCTQSFDLIADANDALRPLNNVIRVPAGLVRAGANIKPNPQEGGSSLVVLFAPAPYPLPPASARVATLSGVIRINPSADPKVLPPTCAAFDRPASVAVQVGPRAVSDLEPLKLGDAPTMPLSGPQILADGGSVSPGSQCSYRLSGLIPQWRHELTFPTAAAPAAGSLPSIREVLALVPANWVNPVSPLVSTPDHDLTAGSAYVGSGGVGVQAQSAVAGPGTNTGDPYFGSRNAAGSPAQRSMWSASQAAGTSGTTPNWSAGPAAQLSGAAPGSIGSTTSSFTRNALGQRRAIPTAAQATPASALQSAGSIRH